QSLARALCGLAQERKAAGATVPPPLPPRASASAGPVIAPTPEPTPAPAPAPAPGSAPAPAVACVADPCRLAEAFAPNAPNGLGAPIARGDFYQDRFAEETLRSGVSSPEPEPAPEPGP